METAAIVVDELRKVFRVRERAPGLAAAARQLFRPRSREFVAVDGISLQIQPGERVAFVGPNGAGKSTTLKLLSGILYPSAGRVRVSGLVPWRDRRALAYRIGTVFGQRTQLWYHLPAADTFELLARVYERDPAQQRARLGALVDAFALGSLLGKPVRQLSLGERMRCEIVASLLHDPEIVFLDEPTIGLDVTAKAVIRDLVRDESARSQRTVLLTSHDTGDIEHVCDRVVVIHRGRLLLDRSVEALRREFVRRKRIVLKTVDERISVDLPGVSVRERSPHRTLLEVDLEVTGVEAVVRAVLASARIHDLSVEDPPMEAIVQAIYAGAESALRGSAT